MKKTEILGDKLGEKKDCLSFNLRKFTEKDREFVFDVKRICYEKYVDEFYGGWNEEKQQEMFEEFLKSYSGDMKIIMVCGERAGFLNGNINDKGQYEQGNICLLPKFQGKGIGTTILIDIINSNIGRDILLKVFKSNPAKRLYERLGFEIYDETNSHFLMIRKAKL